MLVRATVALSASPIPVHWWGVVVAVVVIGFAAWVADFGRPLRGLGARR